jgi:dolichol-phosphate mannosyltransferase
MTKNLSVILCTYNEAKMISETIDKIFLYNPNSEIIIVDDNSTDETQNIIKEKNSENIKLICRKSRGLASACLTGLLYANYENICWIDSNLPDLANKIPSMVQNLKKDNIVIMSRYVEGGADYRSNKRILSSKIVNYFCRLFLNSRIKDYTSGIFAIKKDVLIDVSPICYGHGEYFIEFIYKASKLNYKIVEMPYQQPPDIEGISKTTGSLFRFLVLGINYFTRILAAKFRIN